VSVLLLHRSAGESLNIRGAYLHLLSDTLSSVGVVLGGVVVTVWHVTWVDPLVTVLVAAWVLKEAFSVVREAGGILMERAPGGLELARLEADICALSHVKDLHHVHVWQVSDTETMFEGHVNVDDISVNDTGPIRAQIQELLHNRYGVTHATLQFEYECCKGAGLIVHSHD
jgi:cobalt-zinc-cadmium efflux system protein